MSAVEKTVGADEDDDYMDMKGWKAEHAEPTPVVAVVWTCFVMVLILAYNTAMVILYAEDSTSLALPGAHPWGCIHESCSGSWRMYVVIQLVCMGWAKLCVDVLFLKHPAPTVGMPLPFAVFGLGPAFVLCIFPYLLTDIGSELAKNVPLWWLTAWSAVIRCGFESCVQLHERMGVKGISWWLRWPIQKAPESYTLTYAKGISEFQYTRKRGGNPDAFSSFFIALPVAGITAAVNDDTNMGIRVANSLVQVWMLFVVCVGPFVHITGGQPGMTPDHIFNMNGKPRKGTRMHGMHRGVLGVMMYYAGMYCFVHPLVFVRRMIEF